MLEWFGNHYWLCNIAQSYLDFLDSHFEFQFAWINKTLMLHDFITNIYV